MPELQHALAHAEDRDAARLGGADDRRLLHRRVPVLAERDVPVDRRHDLGAGVDVLDEHQRQLARGEPGLGIHARIRHLGAVDRDGAVLELGAGAPLEVDRHAADEPGEGGRLDRERDDGAGPVDVAALVHRGRDDARDTGIRLVDRILEARHCDRLTAGRRGV